MTKNKTLDNYGKLFKVLHIIFKEGSIRNPVSAEKVKRLMNDEYETDIDKRTISHIVDAFNDNQSLLHISNTKNDYNQKTYYFDDLNISLGEAKAIIDMVHSSKFFSLETKEKFTKTMKQFFNDNDGIMLERKISTHLVGNENDSSFYDVFRLLSEAISNSLAISFIYKKPLPNNNNKTSSYETAYPIETHCWNNTFYVYCLIPKDNKLKTFRIDFINKLKLKEPFLLTDELKERTRDLILDSTNAYAANKHADRLTIKFKNNLYPNIIDKFGKNAIRTISIDPDYSQLTIYNCPISPLFYSWIIGFDGLIEIIEPDNEVKNFNEYISKFVK